MVDADVAVIGGGIIGTTATLALLEAGLRPIVFEPNELGVGTAEGSAGFIHDGEIFPLAEPRMLLSLPAMLLDPLGPLVVRPPFLPRMLAWGMRFLRSMSRSTFDAAVAALADLNRASVATLTDMATKVGASELIVQGGGLKVCREGRTLEVEAAQLDLLKRHGIAAEALDTRALRSLEPNLGGDVAGALWFPTSAHCIDLAALGHRMAAYVRERSTVMRARARRIAPAEDGTWTVEYGDKGQTARAARILVAAGHASDRLLRPLGYRVPLAPGRGYHLMLPAAGVELRHPMIFHEPHFSATPMRAGLRLAGTMEFASADSPPDMRRAQMLYAIALPYLPGLRKTNATAWMGVRPMTPDSLPFIGRAARHPNLYYSFGHGRLGLTQSAISARCITDLIADRAPPVDLRPFDLSRFG
jgi:glycine/D-amino acid oxidase-like deaminating enzyme